MTVFRRTTLVNIGQLEQVDVRSIWPSEDDHFTPWLANDEGLRLLGEWVGMRLTSGDSEVVIGRYRADVVCNDDSDPRNPAKVVIENQLGPSDHDHLGKLLTYASVAGANAGIWIATDFAPEHLGAVKAWNEPPDRTVGLYCVRVAAWRIGQSPAAPTFDVLVRPDSQGLSALQLAPIANVRVTRRRFWIKLKQTIQARRYPVSKTSDWRDYQRFEIGHHVACLSVTRETGRNRARLYLRGGWHQEVFNTLEEGRTEIDEALGTTPEWIPGDDHCSVGFTRDSHFFDESKWGEEIEWMIDNLALLYRVFKPRLDMMQQSESVASRTSDEARRAGQSSSG